MSGGDLKIRTAGLADLGALITLFRSYLEFYGEVATEPEAGAYIAAHLDAGTSTLLLAERDGQPVGFAQLYPTWESLSLSSKWVLADLFVVPEVRRTGVGGELVEAALDLARDRGAGSVSLETARDNEGAQALYTATGFEPDEVFMTYHHDLSE